MHPFACLDLSRPRSEPLKHHNWKLVGCMKLIEEHIIRILFFPYGPQLLPVDSLQIWSYCQTWQVDLCAPAPGSPWRIPLPLRTPSRRIPWSSTGLGSGTRWNPDLVGLADGAMSSTQSCILQSQEEVESYLLP